MTKADLPGREQDVHCAGLKGGETEKTQKMSVHVQTIKWAGERAQCTGKGTCCKDSDPHGGRRVTSVRSSELT